MNTPYQCQLTRYLPRHDEAAIQAARRALLAMETAVGVRIYNTYQDGVLVTAVEARLADCWQLVIEHGARRVRPGQWTPGDARDLAQQTIAHRHIDALAQTLYGMGYAGMGALLLDCGVELPGAWLPGSYRQVDVYGLLAGLRTAVFNHIAHAVKTAV